MLIEKATGALQTDEAYHISHAHGRGDRPSLFEAVLEDLAAGIELGIISAKFHNALADWLVPVAQQARIGKVVLSGGVFQNAYLVRR